MSKHPLKFRANKKGLQLLKSQPVNLQLTNRAVFKPVFLNLTKLKSQSWKLQSLKVYAPTCTPEKLQLTKLQFSNSQSDFISSAKEIPL